MSIWSLWRLYEHLFIGGTHMEVSSRIPTIPTMTLAQLRDPGEKAASTWLSLLAVPAWLVIGIYCVIGLGFPLLIVGVIALVGRLSELFAIAYIKANGARVSDRQFPAIHQVVQDASERLGISPPDVYVMQENSWNALAMRFAGRKQIVLYSGLIDPILSKGSMGELAWIVGHELGHHLAGHFSIKHRLVQLGGWIPWVLLWHQRRGELTCDRIGLYCAQSLANSSSALAKMTVGAHLGNELDHKEAVRQWDDVKDEFFVRYRTIYSTHPHHLWRLAEHYKAASEFRLTV